MKIVLYLVVLVSLLACAKHPSPKRVTAKLTTGTWLMTEFIDNEVSILDRYEDVALQFSSEGSVLSTSDSSATGKWSVSNDKNPTILYLTFSNVDSMHVLADDWVVYKLTKSECTLKRLQVEEGFNYGASMDRLTLVKK
ncbi:MAG: hypothetical protein V4622_06590 [Bacteroidota bacterium]